MRRNRTHIMIDIETAATTADAAIIQIGAVAFDPELDHPITDSFTVDVCLDDNITTHNRRICHKTLHWWYSDPNRALQFASTQKAPETLAYSIRALQSWLCDWTAAYIWANPPTFDLSILRNAYHQIYPSATKGPWDYRREMCFRTTFEMFDHKQKLRIKPTTHHDALADARAQAISLVNLFHKKDLI